MSSDRRLASTGSRIDDDNDKRTEGVIEHSGEIVAIPGEIHRQRIVFDGVTYHHVAEDGDGRWIYRA